MPRTRASRSRSRRHAKGAKAKGTKHAARKTARMSRPIERPRAGFSTAGRDARLRELKKEYKHELAAIMGTAARRRERAKPRKFQEILIWEMDQIRHADARHRAAVDRLTRGIPVSDAEERERAATFTEGRTDKRPSHKEPMG